MNRIVAFQTQMFAFLDSPVYLLTLGSLALFSLADLHARALPGIRIFLIAAVLFGLLTEPWKVLAILFVVGWGRWPKLPICLIVPALFYPALWPVILTATGTRLERIAQGDLWAMGGIACLLGGYAPLFALLGVLFGQQFWRRGQAKTIPALPGMLLGVLGVIV